MVSLPTLLPCLFATPLTVCYVAPCRQLSVGKFLCTVFSWHNVVVLLFLSCIIFCILVITRNPCLSSLASETRHYAEKYEEKYSCMYQRSWFCSENKWHSCMQMCWADVYMRSFGVGVGSQCAFWHLGCRFSMMIALIWVLMISKSVPVIPILTTGIPQ